MNHRFGLALKLFFFLSILTLGAWSSFLFAPPDKVCIIDFEGLQSGEIITDLSVGSGISGCNGNPNNTVAVESSNSLFGSEAAIVFDSSCPVPPAWPFVYCGKLDDDLGTPNEAFSGPGVGAGGFPSNDTALGMVAVLARDKVDTSPDDGFVDDPDDADVPGMYSFDFTSFSKNGVSISSVTILDVEASENENPAVVILTHGIGAPSVFSLVDTGDNGVGVIDKIGIQNVTKMVVEVKGSSALAAITFGESARACWATFGGFDSAFVGPEGQKVASFGGNVGPPPSGHLNVVRHTDGAHLRVPDVVVTDCVRDESVCPNSGSNSPGQPGGNKGFDINVLEFAGTGLLTDENDITTTVMVTGNLIDCGEPQNKNSNDPDQFNISIEGLGVFVADELGGGNVQLHPPVPNN